METVRKVRGGPPGDGAVLSLHGEFELGLGSGWLVVFSMVFGVQLSASENLKLPKGGQFSVSEYLKLPKGDQFSARENLKLPKGGQF